MITKDVKLTKIELIILLNAINESRESLEDWEYPIRMGAEIVEAENLRNKLRELLDLFN